MADEIKAGRIVSAVRRLTALVSETQAPASVADRVRELSTMAALMTTSALDGMADPDRRDIFNDIADSVLRQADLLLRNAEAADTPTLYYNTLRYERRQKGVSFDSLDEEYANLSAALSQALLEGDSSRYLTTLRAREDLQRRIFNRLWVSFPLSGSAVDRIWRMIGNEAYPLTFRVQLVSALMLGLTEWYDDRRMALLASVYSGATDSRLRLPALCGLLLAMWIHRDRPAGKRFTAELAIASALPTWNEDVVAVFLQFIRSRDTERINRKMTEELIPEMMKLRPDIQKRLRDLGNISDPAELEDNPEWEEIFDKSGLRDKLKELSELQEDGGDVMMGTFSSLKSFPFFTHVANWFLPFDPDSSFFRDSDGNSDQSLIEVIGAAPFLCDNDKYSMALSIANIPKPQRDMMIRQLEMQNVNLAEARATELLPEKRSRDMVIGRYVQNIYRFFKLFRRKGEFDDPFTTSLDLSRVPLLEPALNDADTLALVGEFFFKRRYFADALEVFSRLEALTPPSAQLFQKMGLCNQQLGDTERALRYYLQSELLNADSLWTIRRIANCYRTLGQPAKALPYYQRAVEKRPDDLSLALSTGHCLLELERYDEALKHYFKVEFLDTRSTRALRPIAWCALLSGDLARSRDYYNRVAADNPDSTDFLNMGHLELIAGDYRRAADMYLRSIEAAEGHIDRFTADFDADRPMLEKAGVDPLMASIVADDAIVAASTPPTAN